MKIIKSVKSMQNFSAHSKRKGLLIGFVPTMGCLHEGHLSLIKAARKKCDILTVSIFVNPIQFGPKEDLNKYPRNLSGDLKMLKQCSVDVVFCPSNDEMYKKGHNTFVEVAGLSQKLCGKTRLNHFRGVTTVVLKLFEIVTPDIAFFGAKDFQQQAIIKKMVSDLNIPVRIISLPIVREKDGLAMSSRNSYLLPEERKSSAIIYKSLKLAEKLWHQGTKTANIIKKEMEKLIFKEPQVKIDYVSICDPETFEEFKEMTSPALVAIAAHVGKTRLIDNVLLR